MFVTFFTASATTGVNILVSIIDNIKLPSDITILINPFEKPLMKLKAINTINKIDIKFFKINYCIRN